MGKKTLPKTGSLAAQLAAEASRRRWEMPEHVRAEVIAIMELNKGGARISMEKAAQKLVAHFELPVTANTLQDRIREVFGRWR